MMWLIIIIIIVILVVCNRNNKKKAAANAAEMERQRAEEARVAAQEEAAAEEKKKKEQEEFLNSHEDGESLYYASQDTKDVDYQVRLLKKAAKDETFEYRLLVYNTLGDICSSGKGKEQAYFDLEKACEYYKAAGALGAVVSLTKAGQIFYNRAIQYPADAADSAQKKDELFKESAECLLHSASKGQGPAFDDIATILEQSPELSHLFMPRLLEIVQEAESHEEKTRTDHTILGLSTLHGFGCEADVPGAMEHLKISADAGDFNAKMYVEAYERVLANK